MVRSDDRLLKVEIGMNNVPSPSSLTHNDSVAGQISQNSKSILPTWLGQHSPARLVYFRTAK